MRPLNETMRGKVLQAVDRRSDELLQFVSQVVQQPSVTGYEDRVASLFAERMQRMGLELDVWSPTLAEVAHLTEYGRSEIRLGERPNVVGIWRGAGRGRSLALNGHLDVVPPGEEARWQYPPFAAVRTGGRLYGRGSCDMKGSLAAALFAMQALQDAGVRLAGDLMLQCVIAEETSSLGTIAAIQRGHTTDAVLCLEPTGMAVAPAQAGLYKCKITVTGHAVHTAVPWHGVSAFENWLVIFTAIKQWERERHHTLAHPLFDHLPAKAPVHFSKVVSGDYPYMVAERLEAFGRVGFLPNEAAEAVKESFEQRVQQAAESDPWLREHPPVIEWQGMFESWETPSDHALVQAISGAFTIVRGDGPETIGVTYGTDISWFNRLARIPGVLFGAGLIQHAHRADEYVLEAELLDVARTVALTAIDYCGIAN